MASIFSKIIHRELPGHFVHEDEHCVAIMTIAPRNPGHLLVIPRQEIDHWDDLPADLAAHLMRVSQKLSKALKRAFNPERVGLMIVGLDVPHVHIHLFPANAVTDFDLGQSRMAEADELIAAAEKVRQALL